MHSNQAHRFLDLGCSYKWVVNALRILLLCRGLYIHLRRCDVTAYVLERIKERPYNKDRGNSYLGTLVPMYQGCIKCAFQQLVNAQVISVTSLGVNPRESNDNK